MLMFLRIERPTTATRRSHWMATSTACCMRWMFDAKEAISTRPCSPGMIWRNASPTTRSDDVILVAVREDHRPHLGRALAQVGVVGQHEVDAQMLVARERETGVDHDDLAAELEGGHVLADLAEAAERNDAEHCAAV